MRSGWYFVQYGDGSIAIVRWDGGRWQFGSQTQPSSGTLSTTYLGTNVTMMSLNLAKLAPRIGARWNLIRTQIDYGGLGRGEPLVIGPNASTKQGTNPLQPGTRRNLGDATPVNIIPSPIPATVGNSHLSFGGVTDFLNFIGWLFDPRQWLRLAEFWVGIALLFWGLYLTTRRGGGSIGGSTGRIVRRAINVTPVGRELRVAQGRRMGRHEGQREAARMEARQAETRSQREASANERERINVSARRAARESN